MSEPQTFSKILTNPSEELVLFTLDMALESIQKDVRMRKISTISYLNGFHTPSGVLNFNGGHPNKAAGGYSTGQTSRLGIAWWTDINKNKHVKVEADRTQASNFSIPEIFNHVQNHSDIVFGTKEFFCALCQYPIKIEESHWLEASKFACDVCNEEDKYLIETGFLPQGRRKKIKTN